MAKFFKSVFSFLVVAPLLSANLWAQEAAYLSAAVSDYGLHLVKQGKPEVASAKFIQALLLDQTNRTAKEQLARLAESSGPWAKSPRFQLLRFLELVDHTNFLRERIENLVRENEEMLKFISFRGKGDPLIREQIGLIQAKARQPDIWTRTTLGPFAAEYEARGKPLPEVNEFFEQNNAGLANELKYFQGLNNQLHSVKWKVFEFMRIAGSRNQDADFASQFQSIERQLREKDGLLMSQEKNVRDLNAELRGVRKGFFQIQQQLDKTDSKVNDLTHKIAGMSLDLMERETVLVDREARISALEGDLKDTQERLKLVSRIIEEKDTQIRSLGEQVAGLQNNRAKQGVAFGEDGISDKIQSLEKQLKALNEKYVFLEGNFRKREAEISQLRDTLVLKDENIARLKTAFLSTKEKISQMTEILQIYKEKLNDTVGILKEKEAILHGLEEKMQRLESRLREDDGGQEPGSLGHLTSWHKDEILERTKNDLNRLQQHLTAVK